MDERTRRAEDGGTAGVSVQAQRFAIERDERTRLADVLHDGPLQRSLAIGQEVQELVEGNADALAPLVEQVTRLSQELPSLTAAMHDDLHENLDLPAAVEQIAEAMRDIGGLGVRVEIDAECCGINDPLIRDVVRELLHNVLRHAQARAALASVRCMPEDHVLVSVIDDGRGLAAQAAQEAGRRGHLGLARLRNLAQELGGAFHIHGQQGGGTTATLRLPRSALRAERLSDEQARYQRQFLAALPAALQDAMVVFRNGRIAQVNEAFCELTGLAEHELAGVQEPHYPFWPPGQRKDRARIMDRARHSGSLRATLPLQRRDGSLLMREVSASRINAPDDADRAMLALLRSPATTSTRRDA